MYCCNQYTDHHITTGITKLPPVNNQWTCPRNTSLSLGISRVFLNIVQHHIRHEPVPLTPIIVTDPQDTVSFSGGFNDLFLYGMANEFGYFSKINSGYKAK